MLLEVPADEHIEEAHRAALQSNLVGDTPGHFDNHEERKAYDEAFAQISEQDDDLQARIADRSVTESEVKQSNPKDGIGSCKVPMSTLSVPVLMECGLGMLEGAIKYRRHNYRVIGVRASIYYDAAHRHLGAWWEGEDIDPVSGLNHVTKAITSLMVLRDAMIRDKMIDDRPPGTVGFVDNLNERTKELLARFDKHEYPYTVEDGGPDEYRG